MGGWGVGGWVAIEVQCLWFVWTLAAASRGAPGSKCARPNPAARALQPRRRTAAPPVHGRLAARGHGHDVRLRHVRAKVLVAVGGERRHGGWREGLEVLLGGWQAAPCLLEGGGRELELRLGGGGVGAWGRGGQSWGC